MNKIVFASAAMGLVMSFAFGAATTLTAEGVTNLGGDTPVCAYVKASEVANVQLSKNVVGAYECTSARAKIATANYKGNAKSYTADSEGGKIAEATAATVGGAQSAYQTAVGTAAGL